MYQNLLKLIETRFSSNLEESEKKYILAGKHSTKEKEKVPYKALLKDSTIWISLLMFTGYYLAMIVYQQYSPTFIKQVLHFTIRETGYFSAIPQLIAIFIKIGCGRLLGEFYVNLLFQK